MKIEAQNLINYHCPRWNELPEIELYIDQVICVLQNNLAIFLKEENTPVITPNMINNYVKQEVLMPPIKKKYNKTHLAYLFVICILKRLMSISEINESIKSMKKSAPTTRCIITMARRTRSMLSSRWVLFATPSMKPLTCSTQRAENMAW